ncbi:MAG: ABC transporter permease [Alphaproteobacteria bacterium]|nr:ABC transporter permease [Alphaproteobacteria bacterium]
MSPKENHEQLIQIRDILKTNLLKLCQLLGASLLGFLQSTGAFAFFTIRSVSHCIRPPFYMSQFIRQFIDIGYYCLPVVGLTALFSGMVLALQSYSGFSRFSAEGAIATVVVLSMTRELGPVMAGLMVAGRIGASIAAELGTMRVTEQIDALTTLSTNPVKYLVVPRIVAGTAMLPALVLLADIIGVFGGFLVSVYRLDFNAANYVDQTWRYLENMDVISGLVKASVFGFIVTLMGCYFGFNSKGGAQGVGAATTNAVVSSSILILISNYLLTGIFFAK